jgi:hypothetical protein
VPETPLQRFQGDLGMMHIAIDRIDPNDPRFQELANSVAHAKNPSVPLLGVQLDDQ